MPLPFVQVDAFADRPFAGNPAAVCVLQETPPDEELQAIAAEMNLSETAFLWARPSGYDLRWFTPEAEVDLCGHATLASAHVLWEDGYLPRSETAVFHTRSGALTARFREGWIEMDFPAQPAKPATAPVGLAELLGCTPVSVSASRLDLLAELPSEADVLQLRPDIAGISRLPLRGLIVTSAASRADFDFVSRFFAPAVGIAEDPVTGSAHCTLAPYWAERFGKVDLVGFQASRRSGVVRVQHRGERVGLAGQAVTVVRGEILV